MVSLGSVILVVGIGLAIFFREDIGAFLRSFKGFGSGFGQFAPALNIDFPEFPKFPDFEFPKFPEFEFPKFPDITIIKAPPLTDPRSLVELGQVKPIAETFGTTKVGEPLIEGKVIPQLGRVDPRRQKVVETTLTRIPADTPLPIIAGTLSSLATKFGGQTEPKVIINKDTVTEAPTPIPQPTTIIEAKQPDPSLVSPFLKQFQPAPTTSIFDLERRRIR